MLREPEPVDLRLVRELFAAAMALPAEQREAYVRAQANDAALRDQVLALLMAGALRTVDLVAAAQREVPGRPAGQPVPPSAAGDKVQSTATGELMQKLATAPKLDAQRFQLEGEIGKGGMGVVLRIHDHLLNRRLAMKGCWSGRRRATTRRRSSRTSCSGGSSKRRR